MCDGYTLQLYATLKYSLVASTARWAPLGAVPQVNVTPNY